MPIDPATQATPILKLRTPVDIVDAVPHLVGFQPEDSLVCLSLRGARKRLGVVSRVDLPPVRFARQCATHATRYLQQDGARQVIVVFYVTEDGPANGRVVALVDAIAKALEKRAIDLVEALCVHDGRWWSLLCGNDDCCPPEGTPIDQARTSLVAAEMAVKGRVVFKSRADLEQTLQPVRGAVARDMRVALPRERDGMRQRDADGERADFVAESIGRFDDAVRARQSLDVSLPPLDSDDAARLIVALYDVFVRDRVLTWAEGGRSGALRVLLDELVPRAMSGYEAPVLTVHALASYAAGEGALAGIAIERARKAAPDYNLARLVDEALLRCVNPAVIREWLRLFNPDLWVSDNQ